MRKILLLSALLMVTSMLFAQEGNSGENSDASWSALTLKGYVKTEVAATMDTVSKSEYSKWDTWFSLIAQHHIQNYSLYAEVSGRYDALYKRDGEIVLREAYVRGDYGQFSFQAGKQWIAWGRADEVNPVDVINPEDYSEIIIPSKEERKIRVPSLKAQWRMNDTFDVTAVVVPILTKPIMPEREQWTGNAQRMIEAVKNYYITEGIGVQGLDYWEIEDYVRAHVLEQDDRTRVDRTQLGFKFTGTVWDTDFSVYYYEGYWTDFSSPAVRVVNLHQPAPGLTDLPLVPERFEMLYPWFTMIGLDWERTVGAFGLRMEGAYYKDRVMAFDVNVIHDAVTMPEKLQRLQAYNKEEGARTSDVVKCVVGIDRFWGELYMNTQFIVDYIADYTELMGRNQYDYAMTFKINTKVFDDRVTPEMKIMYQISQNDAYFSPGIEYEVADGVKAYLGADVFTGNPRGTIGQYQNSDQVRLSVKYNF